MRTKHHTLRHLHGFESPTLHPEIEYCIAAVAQHREGSAQQDQNEDNCDDGVEGFHLC